MTKIDIEATAREAELKMCRALSFPDSAVGTMNRNSPMFTQALAALLLEKAAQVCDVTPPEPFRPSIEAAHALRQMSAALQSGDRG